MGHMIDFKRPDGSSCRGYLATAGQGRPGVVVIQEWWGLNDQIRGVADQLAAQGYRALVPDLYRGKAALDAHEAELEEAPDDARVHGLRPVHLADLGCQLGDGELALPERPLLARLDGRRERQRQ